MIVNMIKNLENKMQKMQESINKDLGELKNKPTETNNTVSLFYFFFSVRPAQATQDHLPHSGPDGLPGILIPSPSPMV